METTGQNIFKKLSGFGAAVGVTASQISKGAEDMKKSGEKAQAEAQANSSSASKEAQMREKGLQETQKTIDLKAEQNRDIAQRNEEIRNPGHDANAMQDREMMRGGR